MKDPLKGISQYYCFGFFGQPHVVYCRYKSCYCKYCITGQWNNCINVKTVGPWHAHKLKLNIYHDCGYVDPNKRPKKRQKTDQN